MSRLTNRNLLVNVLFGFVLLYWVCINVCRTCIGYLWVRGFEPGVGVLEKSEGRRMELSPICPYFMFAFSIISNSSFDVCLTVGHRSVSKTPAHSSRLNKPRRRPRYCSQPPDLATVPEHEILPDTKPRRLRNKRTTKKACEKRETPLLGAIAGNLIVFLNMYNSFVHHDRNIFLWNEL